MGIRREIKAIKADQQTIKDLNEDLTTRPFDDDGEPRILAVEIPPMQSRIGRWVHGQS